MAHFADQCWLPLALLAAHTRCRPAEPARTASWGRAEGGAEAVSRSNTPLMRPHVGFRGVGVEWNPGPVEHPQQVVLVGEDARHRLIQLGKAGDPAEHPVEALPQ